MIVLLQRVSEAEVSVGGKSLAGIGQGLLAFVGVHATDSAGTADKMLSRLLNYRIFADALGKMNLSLIDIEGGLLMVPQFTLAADTRKGRRPSFTSAAPPQHGESIYDSMLKLARERYSPVESGVFGADMAVRLVNDGPVTFILD